MWYNHLAELSLWRAVRRRLCRMVAIRSRQNLFAAAEEATLAEPKEFGRRAVFGNRVTIDDELYARAKKCAELAGFSTTDEFIEHVLTKEIAEILGPGSGEDATPEEIKKRLQGLGYIE